MALQVVDVTVQFGPPNEASAYELVPNIVDEFAQDGSTLVAVWIDMLDRVDAQVDDPRIAEEPMRQAADEEINALCC